LVAVPGSSPVQKYVFYNKEGGADPPNAVTCSEAHGYGMLISVFMAGYDPRAKADFNALYRFYKAHPSGIEPSLMAWQQVKVGGKIVNAPDGADSATDGDLDIAYALLLADKQWGSGGSINYKQAAIASMRGTMRKVVNQPEWILKLGDWASNGSAKYGKATRTSDFMLNHLRVFAAADPAYAGKWNAVFRKTCSIVNHQYTDGGSSDTGLMPDFMRKAANGEYVPAAANFLESRHDGDYYYNACRTPWRLAMDYLLTGDTSIKDQLMTLNEWIEAKAKAKPGNIRAGYYVKNGPNGQSFVNYGELCFECPFAVSAMMSPEFQPWLNALWSSMTQNHPIASEDYYGNTLKMLVMITVSGNWWTPAD
jgi:endo-1,4-beta-D-glucanase Y